MTRPLCNSHFAKVNKPPYKTMHKEFVKNVQAIPISNNPIFCYASSCIDLISSSNSISFSLSLSLAFFKMVIVSNDLFYKSSPSPLEM